MKFVDPTVRNSLFELLNGLLARLDFFEHTLENMALPSFSEDEAVKKEINTKMAPIFAIVVAKLTLVI